MSGTGPYFVIAASRSEGRGVVIGVVGPCLPLVAHEEAIKDFRKKANLDNTVHVNTRTIERFDTFKEAEELQQRVTRALKEAANEEKAQNGRT